MIARRRLPGAASRSRLKGDTRSGAYVFSGEVVGAPLKLEFRREVWNDEISFTKLRMAKLDKAPISPGAMLNDDIAFWR